MPAAAFFAVDGLSANEAYAKVAAIVHSGVPGERRTWEFQCFNGAFGRNMWLRIVTVTMAVPSALSVGMMASACTTSS